MIAGIIRAQRARRKMKDAREFLRETERMLKRASTLDPKAKQQIEEQQQALRTALAASELQNVERAAKSLDELAHRHLSAYRKSSFREYFESIGFAILVALTLRAFVLEAFKIPSGSMIPTLQIKDQIFVNKYIYGLRVPFTFIKFLELNEPKRGEVIVFIYPEDHHKDYIKRVVAVPGDTVQTIGDDLYVNGEIVPHEKQQGPCEFWDSRDDGDRWEKRRCTAYNEQLGEHTHKMIFSDDVGRPRDYGPTKILPRNVFVMGDNRYNSSDSRVWGQVPYDNIKGRAMFIWFAQTNDGINFSRFFQWID